MFKNKFPLYKVQNLIAITILKEVDKIITEAA